MLTGLANSVDPDDGSCHGYASHGGGISLCDLSGLLQPFSKSHKMLWDGEFADRFGQQDRRVARRATEYLGIESRLFHGCLTFAVTRRGAQREPQSSAPRSSTARQDRRHPQKIPVGSASTSSSSLAKLEDTGSA